MYSRLIFVAVIVALSTGIATAYPVRGYAHRGASGTRPENTLSAFRHSLANFNMSIELDTQVSSDGVVYVLHDSSVDRTTNGTGRINNLDSSYLETLDAGAWYGDEFAGEPLPTLKAALELMLDFPGHSALLDTKNIAPSILPAMANEIMEVGIGPEQYVLACWSRECIEEANELEVFEWTVLITSSTNQDLDSWKELGLDGFHINHDSISQGWVASAQEAGFEVWVWTVNTESVIASACAKGVDGLCGDFPERLNCD